MTGTVETVRQVIEFFQLCSELGKDLVKLLPPEIGLLFVVGIGALVLMRIIGR